MRHISNGIIPNEIIKRKKLGFPVDLSKTLKIKKKEKMNVYDLWFEKNLEILFGPSFDKRDFGIKNK